MTLIVSVVGPGYVFQVSDRRITLEMPDGTRQSREAPAIKTVVFGNRAIFGFTGRAEVDLKRTDLWIADQLKDVRSTAEGLAAMRSRLDEIWRRPQYRHGLTIAAVGYWHEASGPSPVIAAVSNQLGSTGWMESVAPEFAISLEKARPGAVTAVCVPSWISREREERMIDEVARGETLEDAVRPVVAAIREVAADHPEVGPDLILSVLPQATLASATTLLAPLGRMDGAALDQPAFFYLSQDESHTSYGPTFVSGGGVMTDVYVKTEIDPAEAMELARSRKDFLASNRPQRAFVVPVRAQIDGASGEVVSRGPDADLAGFGSNIYYRPDFDECLVLTKADLSPLRELRSLTELEALLAEW